MFGGSAFVPGEIVLPIAPVQNITSIQYYDTAGNLNTLDSSAYIVDTASEPTRIVPVYGVPWPITTWYRPNSVQVSFVAGYPTTSAVPLTTVQGMLLLIGGLYQQREHISDVSLYEVPYAAKVLLQKDSWGGYIH
jgi:uncharacterized phiE125 gp8 family phage protein